MNRSLPFGMGKYLCLVFCVLTFSSAVAQQNMFAHKYWDAFGAPEQHWGYYALNYIGRLNDTIQHAVAIGSDPPSFNRFNPRWSSLCFNRIPFDTTSVHYFPGRTVVPANFNGDMYPDFFVYREDSINAFTIFFGTPKIDSFVEYGVIPDNPNGIGGNFLVGDCDSDGYDDIIISNYDAIDSLTYALTGKERSFGATYFFRGGPNMDSLPTFVEHGTDTYDGNVGGMIFFGKFRDTSQQYLAQVRLNWWPGGVDEDSNRISVHDTIRLFLYPLGKRFNLAPTDSMKFLVDTSKYDRIRNPDGFSKVDLDGNGIDDIVAQDFDNRRYQQFGLGGLMLGFRCGPHPDSQPTYFFHTPFDDGGDFGAGGLHSGMIDLGDVCGQQYHSVLITDDQAGGGLGAAYLFNIGRGYKDSCVAFVEGSSHSGGEDFLGATAIATGDLNNDGLADWIIGSDEGPDGSGTFNGHVMVFLGDTSYATPARDVRVQEQTMPSAPTISCYPNPVTHQILYIIYDLRNSEDATIEISDMLGRIVRAERAPGGSGLWRMRLPNVMPGVYECRVHAGSSVRQSVVVVQ